MKKFIFYIFTLTLISAKAVAVDYQIEIDKFFSYMEQSKSDEAVASIYSSNPYVSSIPDQVQNVKTQLNALNGMVGKLISKEKIGSYAVGKSIVHVTYVAIYERQPIRYEFQFFKINDGWRVYSVSFDSDLTTDVETAAKVAAIKSGN